jgi:hypothetical protein
MERRIMSQAQDEIRELMALQQEATKPRSRSEAPIESSGDREEPDLPAATADIAADESRPRETIQELSAQLEGAVHEIESAATDHPLLVSLVAFTLGVVVGQVFSRR